MDSLRTSATWHGENRGSLRQVRDGRMVRGLLHACHHLLLPVQYLLKDQKPSVHQQHPRTDKWRAGTDLMLQSKPQKATRSHLTKSCAGPTVSKREIVENFTVYNSVKLPTSKTNDEEYPGTVNEFETSKEVAITTAMVL